MWEDINESYMTEESDDTEGEGFRQHPLQWRSPSEILFYLVSYPFIHSMHTPFQISVKKN